MAAPLKPGNFLLNPVDFSAYAGSMAATIEAELNTLLTLDGLPTLSMDPNDREVRDRRRLFVAIARGVVRHLRDHNDAIDVQIAPATIVHPVLHTEGL